METSRQYGALAISAPRVAFFTDLEIEACERLTAAGPIKAGQGGLPD
jgi:hypothetical protein